MSADRTPAPVAVPEGGWQDQYVVRRDDGVVMHRRDGRWYSTASGISMTDEQIDVWIEDGDAWVLDGPDFTPRPEPVEATPLPTEAVEAAARALDEAFAGYGVHDVGVTATERLARTVVAAALPRLRLVPEDDEDTVRVPRDAVERLVSAFRAWQHGSAHQALGQSVVNFLEAANEEFLP